MSVNAACRRAGMIAIGTAVATAAFAAPALAHVTVNPGEAEQGSYTKVAFRVPNEDEKAATTKLEVAFPADHRLESVKVRPTPGWTADVAKEEEAVIKITWSGGRISPGEFQEFEVSMGPLPAGANSLVFPATQTYSSGEKVVWDQESKDGEEPERPAPVLKLTPSSGSEHGSGPAVTAKPVAAQASGTTDGTARALGGAGLVIGLGAAVAAGYGLRRRRAGA